MSFQPQSAQKKETMNDKKNCKCEPHSGVYCNECEAESVKGVCNGAYTCFKGVCNSAYTYFVLCVKWCAYLLWLVYLAYCMYHFAMAMDLQGVYATLWFIGITALFSLDKRVPPTNYMESRKSPDRKWTGSTGRNRVGKLTGRITRPGGLGYY